MLASGSIGTDCVTVAISGLAMPVEDGAVGSTLVKGAETGGAGCAALVTDAETGFPFFEGMLLLR